MSEKTARKIRRRIRLCPGDAIQNTEIQFIQHLRNRKNVVVSSRNPDCAVILQMRPTGRKPFTVKIIVLFKTLRFIPVTLVHAHLLPGLNRNSPIGKKIRRVGENHIELEIKLIQKFNTVALKKSKVAVRGFVKGAEHLTMMSCRRYNFKNTLTIF